MNITHESWPRTHRLTVDDYHQMGDVGLLLADARLELHIDRAPALTRV